MNKHTTISVPLSVHKELAYFKEQRMKSIGTIASEAIALAGSVIQKHINNTTGKKEQFNDDEQNLIRAMMKFRNVAKFVETEEPARTIAISKSDALVMRQIKSIFQLTTGNFFAVILPIYERAYLDIDMTQRLAQVSSSYMRLSTARRNEAMFFYKIMEHRVICQHLVDMKAQATTDEEIAVIDSLFPDAPLSAIQAGKVTKLDFM